MAKGQLFLIPIQISDDSKETIPQSTIDKIHSLKHFIVERARTARRFISQTKPPYRIDELHILEFEDSGQNVKNVIELLKDGIHVGVMSESGMPGIADPGQLMCKEAHSNDISVIPLVGPNSIVLALCASGLDGQNFAFGGYLPIKENELKKKLKIIEEKILKERQTQIFIETPYRNERLFKFILNNLNPKIKLCISTDLTGSEESIKTLPIASWKKKSHHIGKLPSIFILGN